MVGSEGDDEDREFEIEVEVVVVAVSGYIQIYTVECVPSATLGLEQEKLTSVINRRG